ncbi:hypothetical protein MRX96_010961 [Rhipicephalus microplus]
MALASTPLTVLLEFSTAPPSATSAAQPGIKDSAPQPTLRGLDSCADMRYPFTPFAFIVQVLAAACRVEPFDAVGSNQSGQRPILLHDAPAPFHPAPKDGPCVDPLTVLLEFSTAPPSATSAAQPGIKDSAPQPTLRGLDSCADMRYPFTPFAFIVQDFIAPSVFGYVLRLANSTVRPSTEAVGSAFEAPGVGS